MTIIELPDEQAAALKAKANAAGLTLEAWLKQLADAETRTTTRRASPADGCRYRSRLHARCPGRVMATQPRTEPASTTTYIYGWAQARGMTGSRC